MILFVAGMGEHRMGHSVRETGLAQVCVNEVFECMLLLLIGGWGSCPCRL